MDLSISIVSWNTRELLDQCLASVYETTHGIEFEVIVVDNASGDGSMRMVCEKYPRVRIIANASNVGFAKANNQAYGISSGRHFLLLNSDTVVHDSALRLMVEWMDAHGKCGACGPMLLNADGSLQPSWAAIPGITAAILGTHDRRVGCGDPSTMVPDELSRQDPLKVGWVGGACLMVRREVIEMVGTMDEGYFMYCEETDWCWRIQNAGYDVVYVPKARITHLGGASSNAVPVRTVLRLQFSQLRFLWRKDFWSRVGCLVAAPILATRGVIHVFLRAYRSGSQ